MIQGLPSASTSQGLQAVTRLAELSEELAQLNSTYLVTIHSLHLRIQFIEESQLAATMLGIAGQSGDCRSVGQV
jgi:hypothetical protein